MLVYKNGDRLSVAIYFESSKYIIGYDPYYISPNIKDNEILTKIIISNDKKQQQKYIAIYKSRTRQKVEDYWKEVEKLKIYFNVSK